MALGEGVRRGDGFAGIPGAKSLLAIPLGLPFGLDEMKRILPARTRHAGYYPKNRGLGQPWRSPNSEIRKNAEDRSSKSWLRISFELRYSGPRVCSLQSAYTRAAAQR